jgi:hypothetical protein
VAVDHSKVYYMFNIQAPSWFFEIILIGPISFLLDMPIIHSIECGTRMYNKCSEVSLKECTDTQQAQKFLNKLQPVTTRFLGKLNFKLKEKIGKINNFHCREESLSLVQNCNE